MAVPTYADLIALYPEFTTEDTLRQTQITKFITSAERRISETVYGDDRFDVIVTLAAHRLSFGDRSNVANAGGAGAVTSRTTGESIVSYSVQSKGDGYDGYRATPYGQIYLDYMFSVDLTPVLA